jgi:hypothetical protein
MEPHMNQEPTLLDRYKTTAYTLFWAGLLAGFVLGALLERYMAAN